MKKLIFILLIFILGCASMRKLHEGAISTIHESVDNIAYELNILANCREYSDKELKKSCENLHLFQIQKYYNEAGRGLWFIGQISRKELGFDISEIKGYIIIRLKFLNIDSKRLSL